MTFLNPFVLLGLAAAAIPILIHLFNFRKPRRVEFSSLQFLKELERRTMRRMRLRQWLLLVLRTLAIAFLVLAFARPTIESAWASLFGARVETATALLIDDSRSMTVRDAQGDLLTQAVELAQAVAETRRPGDELFLLTTTQGALRPSAFRQGAPALDALAEIEPRPGAPQLGPSLDQAFEMIAAAGPLGREVVVVSDLQARTFSDTVRVPAPEGVRLTLLPVGDRQPANTAITDFRVVSSVVEPGRPATFEATLVHHGPRPMQGVLASLFVDGQRLAEGATDLRPGIPATVRFVATPPARGWLAAEVRIEPDAYEFDDVRHLPLYVPESRRVLVVQGDGQRADHLRLALALGEEAGGRFEVVVVPEEQLAAQRFTEFDVVVLLGPASLASGERAALVRFAEDGGGLMLFPSDRSNAALSELFGELGGGRYGDLLGQVGQQDRAVGRFGEPDLGHPIFDGVLEPGERGPRLESPEFNAAAPPLPTAGQTVIPLDGGQPFLHEVRRGQGTVLAFAAAPDPRWGDFPTRGVFVPLMHRSVAYLAAEAGTEASFVVGDGGSLRLAGAAEGLLVVAPDGSELAPEQRAVPGGVLLDIDRSIAEPGVYAVRSDETTVSMFALNPDPHESDLRALSPAEAARHLEALTGAEVQVLDATGGRGVAAAGRLAEGHAGVELWSLFLLLALLCLVAEQLVAMRWRPQAVPA